MIARPEQPEHPDRSVSDVAGGSLDRRSLLRAGAFGLGGLGIAALVAGCSDNGPTTTEGVDPGPEQSLQALFPRDLAYLAAGVPFRLPYTLVDPEGVPLAELDGPVTFTVSFDGEQVGQPVEVAVHGDGVPRPYLPLSFTFPAPGLYDVDIEYAGARLNSQVQAFPAADVSQPLVGQPLPPTSTPTLEQSFDVDPICTLSPRCPFHEHDLSAVLGDGRPIVALLASPAYCRTTACGPILDLLIEEAGPRDDLIVIHAEVYRNPKGVADLAQAELAPLPADYEMTFEPALFVTDSSNTIVARGDVVVDRVEMAEMLALAT